MERARFTVRDDRPTLLMAGPGHGRMALAEWARRAGLRCMADLDLEALPQQLSRTVAVDLILIDLRGTGMTMTDLPALNVGPAFPDTGLLVLTDLDSVDVALAIFDDSGTQMLCEPTTGEIIYLLVCAALDAERKADTSRFYDSARPDEEERVAQLSAEVRRLASAVDRLTQPGSQANAPAFSAPVQPAIAEALDDVPTPGEIRALLRARRLRDQFLPADLFADPAWDMILDLMAARLSGQRVSVSSLCIAAAVPPTTALRWIRQLTERGIFARIDDPADGRRVFIALTDETAEAVTTWIRTVRRNGGLLPPSDGR